MNKRQPIPSEKLEKAQAMRADGCGWGRIVGATGISLFRLRCALDPVYLRHKVERVQRVRSGLASRKGPKPSKRKNNRYVDPDQFTANQVIGHTALTIPARVLADRDRSAQLEHASLTAALLGDPLPGRSALDRRR